MGRLVRQHRQRQQPSHPVVDTSTENECRADRDPFSVRVRKHLFNPGLAPAVGADRSCRVVFGLCRVSAAVHVRRRGENDPPGPGLSHRLQDIDGAPDIDLMAELVVVAGTFHPRTVRDNVRAVERAFDRGRVPNVGFDEISCTGPTFRPMPGDPGDIVALAEQSGGEAAAEYAASAGDRNSH